MNVVNDNTEKQFDYTEYGYKEGTPIIIDSELFGNICSIVQYVAGKETTVGFEQKPSVSETVAESNRAMYVVSPQGLQALAVSLALNSVHEKNVENGVATLHSELEKPKITLED